MGSRQRSGWSAPGDQTPEGFKVVGSSEGAPFALIANEDKRLYGAQFHPEVIHTPHGAQLLKGFTHGVCGCVGDWTMASFRETEIAKIRERVGDKRVVCGLSGGVDSSVAAVLAHEAIKATACVFVDTGMMRAGEAEEVVVFFDHHNIPLVHADASELFLDKLEGVSDPEEKRKIIGAAFIDVFEAEANKIGGADFLAQGTLYPT